MSFSPKGLQPLIWMADRRFEVMRLAEFEKIFGFDIKLQKYQITKISPRWVVAKKVALGARAELWVFVQL